jgi:uncharacterized protein involved in outer membrane biogenesis
MPRKRLIGVFLGVIGAMLLAVVLYIAFGDLGRHKARIEALVTQGIGRPFAIDGPLELRVFPVVAVSAEQVRLGNAPGGSQPQMIEIGKAVVQIGFWSLISGPPDVRLFELHDATVLLELGPDGKGNWIMGTPGEEADADVDMEAEEDGEEGGAARVPVVIRSAHLNNVRVIYREPKKDDRVIQLDKLTITPGKQELLALEGRGTINEYPLALNGEVGPLKSLLSARDMRIAMRGTLGKASLDVNGSVGSLDPLDGADLTLGVDHPELERMLRKLELPVVATGPLHANLQLKDAGALTRLDFDAKGADFTTSVKGTLQTLSLVGADLTLAVEQADVGILLQALELPIIATGPMRIDTHIKDVGSRRQLDLEAKLGDLEARVRGTLKTRSLVGSDLTFEANAADAARLASVFKVSGVPATPLKVTGHTVISRKQVKFDALTVAIADASLRADGTKDLAGQGQIALQFAAEAASLAKLKETWPAMKVSVSGALAHSKERIELKDLQAALDQNHLAGSLSVISATKHIEAQLSSPRLDLTPFFPARKADETAAATATPAPAAGAEPSTKKFVFDESPLPFAKLKDIDAKLHLTLGEVVLGERSIKHVISNVGVAQGRVTFDFRAAGTHEGTLQSAGTLVPAADGTGNVELKIDIAGLRAQLGKEEIALADVSPIGLAMNIRLHGSSLRQMASGANGHLLLTQGAGKTRSGFITNYGGGVVSQLGAKLNPFAKDEPFMRLDCTIARVDIVDGAVTVKPVVIQTEKVTITADGNIDLRTEKLLLDFNTRPRKGIGVSPGMFTNPLIRLEGTLMSPRIGIGAKGVASGALAAATGGATVVAGGLVDRAKGEQDICKTTLAEATRMVTEARVP